MPCADALQIVLDLAKRAAELVPVPLEEYARWNEAIATVEDMAVNQFGDD